MCNYTTAKNDQAVRVLVQAWQEYAEITAICAPTVSEAYWRCSRQLETALGSAAETEEYPLPI